MIVCRGDLREYSLIIRMRNGICVRELSERERSFGKQIVSSTLVVNALQEMKRGP